MKIKIEIEVGKTTKRILLWSRKHRAISFLLLTALIVPLALWAAPITKQFTFSAGDTLSASKINANFDDLFTKVNSLDTSSAVPTGAVLAFAGTTTPSAFLLCDGSMISRTTYAALFAVIGTSHGSGDGSTTFNLPDYRGRFLRGVDGGSGNDPDASSRTTMNSGGNTGNNTGSVQLDELKSHLHSFQTGTGNGGSYLQRSAINLVSNNTYNTGGTETRPKNAYANFIIKY